MKFESQGPGHKVSALLEVSEAAGVEGREGFGELLSKFDSIVNSIDLNNELFRDWSAREGITIDVMPIHQIKGFALGDDVPETTLQQIIPITAKSLGFEDEESLIIGAMGIIPNINQKVCCSKFHGDASHPCCASTVLSV